MPQSTPLEAVQSQVKVLEARVKVLEIELKSISELLLAHEIELAVTRN